MAEIKITVRKSGPYRIEGDLSKLELVDADGNPYDLTGKPAITLCRCSQSATRPFCDGTHKTCGFVSEEAAPKKVEPAPPAV